MCLLRPNQAYSTCMCIRTLSEMFLLRRSSFLIDTEGVFFPLPLTFGLFTCANSIDSDQTAPDEQSG